MNNSLLSNLGRKSFPEKTMRRYTGNGFILNSSNSKEVKQIDFTKLMIETPFLKFKDAKTESEFGKFVKSSYIFRNALCGLIQLVVVSVIWIIPSILMKINCHDGPTICTIIIAKSEWGLIFDILMPLSIVASLILGLANKIHLLRKNSEISFYFLSFIPFFMLMVFINLVLLDGSKNKLELFSKNLLRSDSAIQFKLWTDSILSLMLFLLIIFYDQMMNTRTIYLIWMHSIAFLAYSLSRILVMIIFKDIQTNKFIPVIILSQTLQIVLTAFFILFSYFARLTSENSERRVFLELNLNQARLNVLRKEHKAKKQEKVVTIQEKLINKLFKAQINLQIAAFEHEKRGDVFLLEQDEILEISIELLNNTENIYSVDSGSDNIYKITKPVSVISGIQRNEYKMAENILSNTKNQQEFFSQDILPQLEIAKNLKDNIGQLAGSLNLLKLSNDDPNLMMKVGSVLLEPFLPVLNISKSILHKYLFEIQRKYAPNPYHNKVHGAMVAHYARCAAKALAVDELFDDLVIIALTIAAIGHDVGHSGRGNLYYINTNSILSQIYTNGGVLENYHAFVSFRLAQISNEVNIFQNLEQREYRLIRQCIIEFILATDMSQHFVTISKFRIRKINEKFNIAKNLEDKLLVGKLCIKVGDLSHAFVDWKQHFEWSLRVNQEFYLQGDAEKKLGIPVSPLCDRDAHLDFAKNQDGFLNFVVMPLVTELSELDYTGVFINDFVTKLVFNRHKWQLLDESEEPVYMPNEITDQTVADDKYSDAVFIQALFAKTIDEINADPLSQSSIMKIVDEKGIGITINKSKLNFENKINEDKDIKESMIEAEKNEEIEFEVDPNAEEEYYDENEYEYIYVDEDGNEVKEDNE